jgi:hypothetical protein
MYQSCYNSHITLDKNIIYDRQWQILPHRERKRLRNMEKERNATSVCWLPTQDRSIWVAGPPENPHCLSPLPVSLCHHLHPYITVSLSFSVVPYGHTTDRSVFFSKQTRKEDHSGETVLSNQNTNQKILKTIDRRLIPQTASVCAKLASCSFSPSNQCRCSPRVHS